MSNKDYTKFSKEPRVEPVKETVVNKEVQPVVEPIVEPVKEPEKTVEPVVEPTAEQTAPTVTGSVCGCTKLNVRSEPDPEASVVCMITHNSKVEINEAESTKEDYKVRLASGDEGFCMKIYIRKN